MIDPADGGVDVGGELGQELELTHAGARRFPVLPAIERLGQRRLERRNLATHLPEQRFQPRGIARDPGLVDRFAALEKA